MKYTRALFALCLAATLPGCASLDKYSFETFVKPPPGDRRIPPSEWPTERSDARALLYADYQARLLQGRGTGSRITRELSDSSLAVGGVLAGAQETLGIAASSIATMGVGMVITRELQGIVNARGRSEAFVDAAYLIKQAQSEYLQFNPDPPKHHMTENGAILVSRVDAAVHATLKSLNGRLPGLLDMQQATQPMTKAGAERKTAGEPQSMFNAAGERKGQTGQPGASKAQVEAAVDAALAKYERQHPRQVDTHTLTPITPTEFKKKTETFTQQLIGMNEAAIGTTYKAITNHAPLSDVEAMRQAVNTEIFRVANLPPAADGKMPPEAIAQLDALGKAFGR